MTTHEIIEINKLQNNLNEFTGKLMNELISHLHEKKSVNEIPIDEVYQIVVKNIQERLDIIKNLGPEVMEKQCIHIANYCFFLWQKLQEIK